MMALSRRQGNLNKRHAILAGGIRPATTAVDTNAPTPAEDASAIQLPPTTQS
jgi:hypothetical protein